MFARSPSKKRQDFLASDEYLDHLRAVLGSRYHVESEIGAGGAARVYVADPVEGGDPVAIKVLREELAAAVARDRFRLEIAVTKTLHHPNILPILASGEVEDLLFYVAPFIRGETLRKRLEREGQLPLGEAIRIARAIASGLAEAHRQGVVHRDIKPENILLEGDRVVVADFGIARAITEAAGDRLTSTGIAIGTPGYMSPEQSSGSKNIDRRCDIYALGCVVYEMLAAEGPYTGPSAHIIVAKQLSLPTPSLRTVRTAVPPAIDRAVRRALEKVPADRFDRVEDFAAALEAGAAGPSRWEWAHAPGARRAAWAGAAVAVAASIWLLAGAPGAGGGTAAADTTRYLVLPVAGTPNPAVLHDALLRWRGVSVVDAAGAADSGINHAVPLARRSNAGRILGARTTPAGDSTRVSVGLYDATGTLLAESVFRMARSGSSVDALFAAAVDTVLFRGSPSGGPDSLTTRSLPARQAFLTGKRALTHWDLPGADSAFLQARVFDPDYPQAALWLAVTRAWSGVAPASWRLAAQHAALRQDRLSVDDRVIALAIAAEGDSDWSAACPHWQQGTERDKKAFEVWYGWARCLARDDAVIRDARSRSGWRFRSSYYAALQAYQQAFARDPGILASFRRRSFEWLRRLLLTSGSQLRWGRAPAPDTLTFLAYPELQDGTVEFVPFPRSGLLVRPPSSDAAVRELQSRFREIAATWASADPKSGGALEALAIGMAMLGDPAALDTLNRARAVAADPVDRFRLADTEVWMRLGLSLPTDRQGLERVRRLADSLLNSGDASADAASLESLAALTGKASRAAAFGRAQERLTAPGEPAGLRDEGPALLIYAALGGPSESLAVLEPVVRRTIGELSPDLQGAARDNWLVLPASLAYPGYQFGSLRELAVGDPILRLELAAVVGDTATVREGLRRQRVLARTVSPASLTFDGLLPEASLALWLGSPRDAAEWLDAPLDALGVRAPDLLASAPGVASLVRVMALRAEIAERLGDHAGAIRWANAVVTLWSGGDAFLQPLIIRQRQLMR
ncbi:MAG TPA: serine/threonine-protein kinase [Gemmatimonadales bacterium]|nr:serine/threonine-protein kinase [Gemmatimonadales bacterium]